MFSMTAALVEPGALRTDDGPRSRQAAGEKKREQSQKLVVRTSRFSRALGATNVGPLWGPIGLARSGERISRSWVVTVTPWREVRESLERLRRRRERPDACLARSSPRRREYT
jgi:uncharacterized protein with von Willebrand factor type A (vWA) domain